MEIDLIQKYEMPELLKEIKQTKDILAAQIQNCGADNIHTLNTIDSLRQLIVHYGFLKYIVNRINKSTGKYNPLNAQKIIKKTKIKQKVSKKKVISKRKTKTTK